MSMHDAHTTSTVSVGVEPCHPVLRGAGGEDAVEYGGWPLGRRSSQLEARVWRDAGAGRAGGFSAEEAAEPQSIGSLTDPRGQVLCASLMGCPEWAGWPR